jgi:hypothetical protein
MGLRTNGSVRKPPAFFQHFTAAMPPSRVHSTSMGLKRRVEQLSEALCRCIHEVEQLHGIAESDKERQIYNEIVVDLRATTIRNRRASGTCRVLSRCLWGPPSIAVGRTGTRRSSTSLTLPLADSSPSWAGRASGPFSSPGLNEIVARDRTSARGYRQRVEAEADAIEPERPPQEQTNKVAITRRSWA